MDLMTYALCKGNGSGGGLPTPAQDGQILVSDNGTWRQENIRNTDYPLQEIWVNFDGQGFSLDTTKTSTSDLSLSKYKTTAFTYIYVNLDGNIVYFFPAYLSFTNGYTTATYQTCVIALDAIGLGGNVGYLYVDISSEAQVTVGLNYWSATNM